ncbi:hypothetical protein QTP70_030985 [Hemibagrus guttatus]|uniref:Uncharacterized protein n=1 Tax=Hemibagrus guttatus TaxID=175788 RepID=A0AAE0R393_9TELE|nr:hypothetical protein QTP70_030985 [Hemibagrus guttatus]
MHFNEVNVVKLKMNFFFFFHSIVCTAYPIYHQVTGSLCDLRRHRASRQDTPWTECQPITGHTHTHTHYRQFRDSNQPRSMALDCGRKPEHPEETHQAQGEHANSTHAIRKKK